ncbi:hypothetical protein SKAU_G00413010 [Synaphobranchus kaupii]|uniref:Uncharacterized protein n=1 Tax=Synaphobranchus kaupii TaxID=118154 RepID=A0A9Q1E884_SYNKA|nr:hypothetical protein SKAU_G00413010 [Synaphobranchus kaupii]
MAKRHLEGAAAQRPRQKPKGKVSLLPIGSVVYRRNHVQGRNKIQDIRGSTKYRVVSCLDDVGRVYAVCPLEGIGPVKNFHRTELRVVPVSPTPEPVPGTSDAEAIQIPAVPGQDEDREEDDNQASLMVAVPSRYQESRDPTSAPLAVGSEGSMLDGPVVALTVQPTSSGDPSPLPQPAQCESGPTDTPVAVARGRRTPRVTAGQQSNLHNLPRIYFVRFAGCPFGFGEADRGGFKTQQELQEVQEVWHG